MNGFHPKSPRFTGNFGVIQKLRTNTGAYFARIPADSRMMRSRISIDPKPTIQNNYIVTLTIGQPQPLICAAIRQACLLRLCFLYNFMNPKTFIEISTVKLFKAKYSRIHLIQLECSLRISQYIIGGDQF